MLEVVCSRPARALLVLEGIAGVSDAALFGDRLHAVVDKPEIRRDVEREMANAGFNPVAVRAVPPSLEDVFIRVIRDAENGDAR